MPSPANPISQNLEHAFERSLAGLARAARDLGANALAVLVLDAGSLEIAYPRPPASISCAPDIRAVLESASSLSQPASPARFLTSAIAPHSRSFLLFPWRAAPSGVTIVFGFESPEPPCSSLPPDLLHSLNLASLAASSMKEVTRLRQELRQANLRFAGRKLVDRAKGLLQSERGMTEQQAYEYLRRTSRQRRVTLAQLAEDLLGAARWP